jgi:hypothetical protein
MWVMMAAISVGLRSAAKLRIIVPGTPSEMTF